MTKLYAFVAALITIVMLGCQERAVRPSELIGTWQARLTVSDSSIVDLDSVLNGTIRFKSSRGTTALSMLVDIDFGSRALGGPGNGWHEVMFRSRPPLWDDPPVLDIMPLCSDCGMSLWLHRRRGALQGGWQFEGIAPLAWGSLTMVKQ